MSNCKRVLHVFGAMDQGGAETRTMEIYRTINKNEVQFDFLTTKGGEHYYNEEIRKLGGRIFVIKPPKEVGLFRFIKSVMNLIKEKGPFYATHAHTSHNSGIISLASRLAGVKLRISHARTSSDRNNSGLLRRTYFFISRLLILANSNKLVACGYKAGSFLFGERIMKSGRVKLLPNAINLSPYLSLSAENKEQKKAEIDINTNNFVVGHVGSFRKVKNHNFLIELFSNIKKCIPNAKLVLVGDGELRDEIKAKVIQLKIEKDVFFLGKRSDIPEILNMFDVFLLPSYYEGIPGVIVEAQAAKVPSVISETVTKEVDLGLGLTSYVDLNEPYEKWVDAIKLAATSKNITEKQVVDKISSRGYEVNTASKVLMTIYDLH
ncbi:glycosyltransferase family 1 protein [Halobacillus shinanisalinarum]|uniref:Glycosyltransferase family 1 protein n=1 Tax=Halobacillus shinanisalinarum TaxID=2932258 RepID=A0ABY4H3R1_9BACI|nr:glycosyltransferase family 1 protein [Halobacillus shinanisalinarum]UOQ95063.1 glycosyltransferase family 1 protein [Halobacillus shinanisalinarum]